MTQQDREKIIKEMTSSINTAPDIVTGHLIATQIDLLLDLVKNGNGYEPERFIKQLACVASLANASAALIAHQSD